MPGNLKFNALSDHVLSFATAGTATGGRNSSFVDMQGADGVYFVGRFGTAATQNFAQLAHASATSSSGTNLGSTIVRNQTHFRIDAYRPSKRFVRLRQVIGSASVQGDAWAIRYNLRRRSATATTQDGTFVATPT